MENITASTPQDLTTQAQSAYEAEEFQQAARLFGNAADLYKITNDDVSAAEAMNNQSVALLKAGDASAALAVAEGTDQVFALIGDQRRQGMALGNMAAALEDMKERERAIELYHQSAVLFEKIGESDLRALVLQRISAIQMQQGKRVEAMATMQDGLSQKKSLSLTDRVLKGLLRLIGKMSNRS
jgi:tetratricopeptide (TPR) repeat protein